MFGKPTWEQYKEQELNLLRQELRDEFQGKYTYLEKRNEILELKLSMLEKSKQAEISAESERARAENEVECNHWMHVKSEEMGAKYEALLDSTTKSMIQLTKSVTDKFELPKAPELKILPVVGTSVDTIDATMTKK